MISKAAEKTARPRSLLLSDANIAFTLSILRILLGKVTKGRSACGGGRVRA
jgi:hypothetical protein